MSRSRVRFQLPFNTPFREIEEVLKACRNRADGVRSSAIRDLLKVGHRTLQYKKYAFFWTGWVAEDGGRFFLTDYGLAYLAGDQKEKFRSLRKQLKGYPCSAPLKTRQSGPPSLVHL